MLSNREDKFFCIISLQMIQQSNKKHQNYFGIFVVKTVFLNRCAISFLHVCQQIICHLTYLLENIHTIDFLIVQAALAILGFGILGFYYSRPLKPRVTRENCDFQANLGLTCQFSPCRFGIYPELNLHE